MRDFGLTDHIYHVRRFYQASYAHPVEIHGPSLSEELVALINPETESGPNGRPNRTPAHHSVAASSRLHRW